MKKSLPNYWFLILFFTLFSTNAFAQAPADPGDDPMTGDSAKYVASLKGASNNKSTSRPNFLADGKDSLLITNQSDNLYLGKKEEENTHIVF